MPDPPMMPRMAWVMGRRRIANGEWRIVRRTSQTLATFLFATHYSLFAIGATRRSMHVGPHLALGEIHQPGEDQQEDHHLEADALALLEVRLGRPHHEGGDVLRILIDRRGAAVGVLDAPVG